MNERIKELAKQAEWRFADQATDNFSEYDKRLEKFAELIVRECAEVSTRNPYFSGFSLRDLIKKHFGVE